MDESQLRQVNNSSPDTEAYDEEGLPRYFRIERRWSAQGVSDAADSAGSGFAGSALIETPLYGVFSADSELSDAESAQSDGRLWTLRQRDLPMPNGWRVNNELGVISAPGPDTMRLSSRVYVPFGLINGASTQWLGASSQVALSEGQPGRLEGTPVAGFKSMGGRVWNAGLQAMAGSWTLAARGTEATQITPLDQTDARQGGIHAGATQVALARALERGTIQFNALGSTDSRYTGLPQGSWLDADWRSGKQQYSAGAYRLEPGLSWAGTPLASDVSGFYGRVAGASQRWSFDGGADVLHAITNPDNGGYYALGNARWRYDRETIFGIGASVRSFQGEGWSQYTDVRWTDAFAQTGVRLDMAQDTGAAASQIVTVDRSWKSDTDIQYAVALTGGQRAYSGLSSTNHSGITGLWATSLSAGGPLGAAGMMRLQLGAEQLQSGEQHQSAMASLQWRLNSRWSLASNLYYSRGLSYTQQVLDPLTPPTTVTHANEARALYVVLRYESQAGRRTLPLGGAAKSPAGRVEGVVYMDANDDGVQQASELGVVGAVAVLDHRYAVKTDSAGHFEFPLVVAGPHSLAVADESLPLPWKSPASHRTIALEVRDNMWVALPVRK